MYSKIEVTHTGIPLEAYDYGASLPTLNEKTEMPNKALHSDGNSAALHCLR